MQKEILQKLPEIDIHVYTVWLPVLPDDERGKIRTSLLSDERVSHFWDPEAVTGTWFAERRGEELVFAWDLFLLYDGNAEWHQDRSGAVSIGNPVIKTREKLSAALDELLRG